MQTSTRIKIFAWVIVFIQFLLISFLMYHAELNRRFDQLICLITGLLIAFWALFESRKSKLGILPIPLDTSTLIKSGPYKYIRHPISSGILVFFLPNLWFFDSIYQPAGYVLLLFCLLYKIRFEEIMLKKRYPDYSDYSKHTYRLIMFIF